MSALILVFTLTTNANAPSYFIGTDAGLAFKGDVVSHVFVGPYAGNWWTGMEKRCPLFILNDSQGNELLEIDRRGVIHRKAHAWTIRAAFKNYQMNHKVTDP